jgi:hypothetical protein
MPVLASGQTELTTQELGRYRNQGIISSGKARYYCPIHGGDNQRSLAVNPNTNHFKCYSCGAWGYLDRDKKRGKTHREPPNPRKPQNPPTPPPTIRTLPEFEELTPGGIGAKYLESRGISLEVALRLGVKFEPGERPSAFGGGVWEHGRLVFPHTEPGGRILNYYGRAIGEEEKLKSPILEYFKKIKHRHLPGAKGIFNAKALAEEVVYITEGAFDALVLLQAEYNACAIFGTSGMKWEWTKAGKVVLCMDADGPGQIAWRKLAPNGKKFGKRVFFIPAAQMEGYKDINDIWRKTGTLPAGLDEATQERTQPKPPNPGIPILWENLNGVISEVTAMNPYRREAVKRFFQVEPGGDPGGIPVNYTHDFNEARRLFVKLSPRRRPLEGETLHSSASSSLVFIKGQLLPLDFSLISSLFLSPPCCFFILRYFNPQRGNPWHPVFPKPLF